MAQPTCCARACGARPHTPTRCSSPGKRRLRSCCPPARALLRIAAFGAEAPIPLQLLFDGDYTLRRGTDLMAETGAPGAQRGPEAQDPEIFVRDVLGELKSYSMAQLQSARLGGKVLDVALIDLLVQTVERASLSPATWAHWKIAAASLERASADHPTDPREWPLLRLATATFRDERGSRFPPAAGGDPDRFGRPPDRARRARRGAGRVARVLRPLRSCARADRACRRNACALSPSRWTSDSRATPAWTSRRPHNAGSLLADAGRVAEAEPLERRALALDQEVLGPDDPEVADALSRLVSVLARFDRWNQLHDPTCSWCGLPP